MFKSPKAFKFPAAVLAVMAASCSESPEDRVTRAGIEVVQATNEYNSCLGGSSNPNTVEYCTPYADRITDAEANFQTAVQERDRAVALDAYLTMRLEAVEECISTNALPGHNFPAIAQRTDEELIAAGCVKHPETLLALRAASGI